MLGGLGLILGGVALGSGVWRPIRAAGRRRDLKLLRQGATVEDADFLVELLTHEEVEPYLSAISVKDREGIVAAIERSEREPEAFGLFVVEVDGRPAGTMRFEGGFGPSRIARLGGLAIHPDFRGRGLGDEAACAFQGHVRGPRLPPAEAEVYGFNERSLAHAERNGLVREGVKRKAYWRHGDWADGVVFGLLREDIGCRRPSTSSTSTWRGTTRASAPATGSRSASASPTMPVSSSRACRSGRSGRERSSPLTAAARLTTRCGSSAEERPGGVEATYPGRAGEHGRPHAGRSRDRDAGRHVRDALTLP